MIWLAGDFNLPDIDWSRNAITGHQYKEHSNETFNTLESELGLHQVIDTPTREDNILDLFFTNRPTLVKRSTVIPGISDHHAVYIDSHITMTRKKPVKQTIFMWGKADIQGIKEMCKELSNSVVQKFTSMSNINDVWSFFRDECQRIIEDNVPSRSFSQRFTQTWINRDLRRITRLKQRWFRRARRSKHPNDWLRYKALKKQAQKTWRETHDKYTNDMLTNDNKNPKRLWNFIKSSKKDSTGVASLKKDGLTFSNSLNKANIMGDQFCSVFTQEDISELPDLGPNQTPQCHP